MLTHPFRCCLSRATGRPAISLNSEEAAAEPAAPAAPAYKASTALPFLEYPPNLAGYVGDAGFDPFRFSDFVPMDFLRHSELKHGRICMMAVVGFAAVDLGFHIYPFPEAYEGLTSVTAHDALVKQGAMGQMLLWFSFLEVFDSIFVVQMMEGSGRAPADYGLDGGLYYKKSAEEQLKMATREITHCRLAMMAFSGMVTQAVLTQGPFPYF